MKAKLIVCTIVGVFFGFGAGWVTSLKVTEKVQNSNTELIDAQCAALEAAEKVMWNNNLFDIDGSDDMDQYLYYANKVDSLYNTPI